MADSVRVVAMPVAVLIADQGATRDAVGLYLAGRGWTTVPVDPEPTSARAAVAALGPDLVAIDYRGRAADAAACLEGLAGVGVCVLLFNAPLDAPSDGAGVVLATGPEDVPDAPGTPASPHPL